MFVDLFHDFEKPGRASKSTRLGTLEEAG